jgi:hypothetical protein
LAERLRRLRKRPQRQAETELKHDLH